MPFAPCKADLVESEGVLVDVVAQLTRKAAKRRVIHHGGEASVKCSYSLLMKLYVRARVCVCFLGAG